MSHLSSQRASSMLTQVQALRQNLGLGLVGHHQGVVAKNKKYADALQLPRASLKHFPL